MTDQTEEHQQIIARCWEDEAFKRRLKADPLGTLRWAMPLPTTLRDAALSIQREHKVRDAL